MSRKRSKDTGQERVKQKEEERRENIRSILDPRSQNLNNHYLEFINFRLSVLTDLLSVVHLYSCFKPVIS